MNRRRAVLLIARWEFLRFFKWRELIVTIAFIVGAVVAVGPILDAIVGDGGDVRLAVPAEAQEGDDAVARALAALAASPEPVHPRLRFEVLPLADAEAAVRARTLDGLLVADGAGGVELRVAEEPDWAGELGAVLEAVVVPLRLEAEGLAAERVADVLRPPTVDVVEIGAAPYRGGGLIAVVVGALVFSVFTGAGVLFSVITGEKTQRVTEAIVSAVSPQAWIDGKILGTSLFVLAYLVTYAVGITISFLLYGALEGAMPPLPALVTDPWIATVTLVFAALGFALWFTIFAGVAATVSDPTTSSRGGFIMLPGAALSVGFLGLVGDVDGWLFRTFALFPLTSPSALPVRMLAGSVAPWEVFVALALLVASVLFARRAAGRVFAFAIHMTGKEPTWGEIARWIRAR